MNAYNHMQILMKWESILEFGKGSLGQLKNMHVIALRINSYSEGEKKVVGISFTCEQ